MAELDAINQIEASKDTGLDPERAVQVKSCQTRNLLIEEINF